ncbi:MULTISPECIES: type I polyketide synthase [Micromonospora]|uniref:SDR family NAD(P)-dependent oxidoreductase n=2 Tax=Micromonospora TaxID=1873 RepID=A0ABX9WMQ3_9ACTN|nr:MULTISPECIES: type I polyketide synthase [Micromonospora]NES13758.1 SDR family NAD(P)-dependent oxidoreductase [Micromonospora sp. PPF5-17B]NES35549.1 SDR family NAD(P)-dependent oxidoreductase [Micromonospora solifontis]NES55965.1 SDR family NAD(P)-dependent oxidoreductase [Micromonospora sp. PPF5-6]RNM00603.1 SDR family NAD(P)-dependent oxidoreductase [Micromonospora solifontis]
MSVPGRDNALKGAAGPTGSVRVPAGLVARSPKAATLVDRFRTVLLADPDAFTYRFLIDGEDAELVISNADMDRRARAIAATLRDRVGEGDRALIVCPPGLDYLAAFLGCLYARVIAVPVYPPNPVLLKRTLPRLIGVIEDAQPAIVLAPAEITAMAGQITALAPVLGTLVWQAVDRVDQAAADRWREPDLGGDDIAFLQYTSGSTGRPKGVVLSHGNLLANLAVTNQRFVTDVEDTRLVSWLPPYHDMGLIGAMLQPLYAGFSATFMSPTAFLKRPLRWLQAISTYRGTLSGSPNFGYELCVAKTTPEERAALDLSSWRLAFSGAEPVRAETIDRFAEAFAPSGFRRSAFYPCYGLAEATLFVSGGLAGIEPDIRRLRAADLTHRRAVEAGPDEESRTLVSCGSVAADHDLAIVDPETGERLPAGHVGEIWFSGASVAQGYWQRPQESEQTFRARIAGTGAGPFLRTGDLGFVDEHGELFVTGRHKDLIIIAGRNHYPSDIEFTVERSDPHLRPGCGVACSVEVDGEERLVVIHEVGGNRSRFDPEQVIAAIRGAVAQEHGLQVHDVVLIKQGGVPKTSSGKLQRRAARQAFLDGGLETLANWSAADPERIATGARAVAEKSGPASATSTAPPGTAGRAEIERRLIEELAARLKVDPSAVDPTRPIATYGLQSVDMVGMVGEVERWLGRELPATLIWEYPTIDALVGFLGAPPSGAAPTGPAAPDADPAGPVPTTAPRAAAAQRLPGPAGRAAGTASEPAGRAEPVAVIGIGCRLPGGVDGPESFWQLLTEGRDAIREVPADRWDVEELHTDDPDVPGRTTTRWGGFLDRIDRFDPHFFGISAREAARMDPQQRLLAEVTWEALEDAGIVAEDLASSATGVFIGIATNDYGQLTLADLDRVDAYTGTGNAFSIAANRLSYLFDLRGPSIAVDTACSASLVAVHQAVASLARGDCTLAVAGGVNVVLSPALAINFSKAGAMAADGRCKAFDARADGYVRAEGAGVVVLKPLSAAVADADPIYAVILGGAVNQDGRTNGLMAPNPHAQQEVLRRAYERAGVPPAQVGYVEAHGTGTLLGDPIEARALAAVACAGRDPRRPLLIGSVKSNLGHLESAAGIAGLIKTALILRHREIPPSLHYRQPNPHIPFGQLGLRVVDTRQPWPTGETPAVAGVSSFGFGGTNAHLVLGEAPRDTRRDPAAATPLANGFTGADGHRPIDGEPAVAGTPAGGSAPAAPHLLTVSARTPESLRELAARYAARLAAPDAAADLAAVCAAAAVRRSHHEQRLACVGGSPGQLRDALAAYAAGEERAGLSWGGRRVGRRPRTVFMFSGQGPRWWPLSADLLAVPAFRDSLAQCDRALRQYVDWSLLDLVTDRTDEQVLSDPAVAQPALTAVQIALAALWRSWGIEPDAVVGHSVGEVAAAQVAGVLGIRDAMRVARQRGRVIRAAIGNGRMAVVGLPLDRTRRLLGTHGGDAVSVAASNGPESTVLSGDGSALAALAETLQADGIFCRLLESVDYASHSVQMEPLRAELRALLEGLKPTPATVPIVSTVTARPIDGTALDAGYWATNLREPVLFDEAVTGLLDAGHDVFVEISPHPVLGEPVTERIARQQRDAVVVASLRRDEAGHASMLGELGRLYTAGHPVDWRRMHGPTVPMVPLPAYAWQRERHWITDEFPRSRRTGRRGHPVLETYVPSAAEPGGHHFTARIDLAGFGWLRDHVVEDTPVLPASLLLDAALSATRRLLDDPTAVVERLALTRVTVVGELAEGDTLQLVLLPETGAGGTLRVYSRPAGPDASWSEVARGRYGTAGDEPIGGPTAEPLDAVRTRCAEPVDTAAYYARLDRAGLRYGPAFRGIAALWRAGHEAVAELRDPVELTGDRDPYLVHPALLDSCLQVLAAALNGGDATGTYLPVGVARFRLAAGPVVPRWAHATVDGAEIGAPDITGARVLLHDATGKPVGEIAGIGLRLLAGSGAADPVAGSLLDLRWQEASGPAAETDAATGWWLLLAGADPVGAGLRAELAGRGVAAVTVAPGDAYRQVAPDRYEIDPARPADFAALLTELRAARPEPCAGVVHAWSLDAVLTERPADPVPGPPDDTGTAAPAGGRDPQLDRVELLGPVAALHLVQALDRAAGQPPRLVLVTRGAQLPAAGTGGPDPAQAGLWGLGRVAALEHGELRPTLVDLDPVDGGHNLAGLVDELLHRRGGEQVALRDGRRYTPRLGPWQPPAPTDADRRLHPFDRAADGNYRILSVQGHLGSLTPVLWERTPPGPGQVQIEVTAAGLNFNDVLKAMEICPGVPKGIAPLGGECAGRITALGEGVTGLRVGDRVMAVAPSSMAAYTTTLAELVARIPDGLTDEQAAAVPIAFLTVVYGLEYLGHLGAGDTVLIHSATGGVGLAALQVARRNGAEVLATAGSEEKRDLLRRLGVKHVMDSRSLRFADEVAALTDGRGVDVVLNSLTGAALTRSLGLLAPNGRFVEIGKQDIYADRHLGLQALRHNRSFLAVDLERVFAERPKLIARLFAEVLRGFDSGEFTALPVTPIEYGRAAEAFGLMAQARHTGKIVLRPDSREVAALPPGQVPVRPAATYLITGGLGALGLETARWLADRGARHLVLVGRSRPSAAAERVLAELIGRGVDVQIRQADIARYDEVAAVLAAIDRDLPPLAGVVHAAGVLDDGLMRQLDRARFRAVAAPKVDGAWHLHRATLDRELDFFVLFSSAAALLGSPGQANYATANAFLDALAHHRRAQGRVALSINWGPWSEAGLAARPDRGGQFAGQGIASIHPRDGIEALDRLVRTPTAQAGVLPLEHDRLRAAAAAGLVPALLATLVAGDAGAGGDRHRSGEVRRGLLAVEPGRRRRTLLTRHVCAEVARVLKVDPARVDVTAPLADLGFDSLMSLELRKRLEVSLDVELSATLAWQYPTIDSLVPFLAERMDIPLAADGSTPATVEAATAGGDDEPPTTADDELATELEQLSDDDVEALLLAKLTQIDEGPQG